MLRCVPWLIILHKTIISLQRIMAQTVKIAVCCSALQCVAVCCSVLQCVAVCCSVLQCVAVCCSVLQCVAVHIRITHETHEWVMEWVMSHIWVVSHMWTSHGTHVSETCHTSESLMRCATNRPAPLPCGMSHVIFHENYESCDTCRIHVTMRIMRMWHDS